MTRLYLMILMPFVVAACGQSGPLYLPGNPSEVQEPPAPPPAENDDEDDEEAGGR